MCSLKSSTPRPAKLPIAPLTPPCAYSTTTPFPTKKLLFPHKKKAAGEKNLKATLASMDKSKADKIREAAAARAKGAAAAKPKVDAPKASRPTTGKPATSTFAKPSRAASAALSRPGTSKARLAGAAKSSKTTTSKAAPKSVQAASASVDAPGDIGMDESGAESILQQELHVAADVLEGLKATPWKEKLEAAESLASAVEKTGELCRWHGG